MDDFPIFSHCEIPLRVKAFVDDAKSDTARALWRDRKELRAKASAMAKGWPVKFVGVVEPGGWFPRARFKVMPNG